jgi:hypothetical protein
MIHVHMGDDQGLNAGDVKADRRKFSARRRLATLFKATVDKQASGWA